MAQKNDHQPIADNNQHVADSTSPETVAAESAHSSSDVNDASQVKNEQTKDTPKASSKKKLFILGLILIVLIGLIAFGLWKSYQPKTVDVQGRVDADSFHVSTKVPSRIESILVHEGDQVKKGQLLVILTSPEIEAKKQQALASLQSALALQSTVERGTQQENIESLYANWQGLKAQADLAQTTFKRGETLYQQGVISRQRRDQMQAAAVSSSQMAEASYQQYARAERGSTPQQKSSADAQVQIAKAAVAETNALDEETKLYAPIDGTVSKTYGKPSELVSTAVPVVSVLQENEKFINLNVREDQYAQVYQAKTLEGFIPALNKTASFKIKNIDAEGEFATIKTTRQTGGYDIRSFRIKLIPSTPIADLKVGMSVIFKLQESQ